MEACNGISLTKVSYDDLKTALFTYFNLTPEDRRAQVRKFKKRTLCLQWRMSRNIAR